MLTTLAFFGGSPGGGEILLVLAVLLMLFGARRVPSMARQLGKILEDFRRASRDVTREVMYADEDDEPSVSPPPYDDLKAERKPGGEEKNGPTG